MKKPQTSRDKRGYYSIKKVPHVSTTTFLKIISKSFLMGWYASMERKKILEIIARGLHKKYSPKKILMRIEAYCLQVKNYAADEYTNKRGDAGTIIHDAIHVYLSTGKKTKIKDKKNRKAFKNFVKWWAKGKYKILDSEVVISDPDMEGEGPVAGTMDAYILRVKDKKKGLFDWKTGKGIYPESHLQLMVYRHLARKSHPSSFGMIVHIPQDGGKIKEHPLDEEKYTLKIAVAALKLWRGMNE